jgi:riboflavin-specific deaminase-like protein
MAMTADGKIAPASRVFAPFGSARDQELLLRLRARADAVMAGARTIDSFPVKLSPGGEKYRELRRRSGLAEFNLRVVVSGSGTLDPVAEIFRHRFSPIIVLTTERITGARLKRLQAVADAVKVCGRDELDFATALRWLRTEWGVKRLLCEGGGELNAALFRLGLVDELYLTICPLVFGGRAAPTIADGAGAQTLAQAANLRLKSMERVGDEVFLVFRAEKAAR